MHTNETVDGHERRIKSAGRRPRVHAFFIHVPEGLQARCLVSAATPSGRSRLRGMELSRHEVPDAPPEHRISLHLCHLRSRDRRAGGLPRRASVLLFRLCSQWTLQLFL
jgi:hypothetical protein